MKKFSLLLLIAAFGVVFLIFSGGLRAQMAQGFRGKGFLYPDRDPKTLKLRAIFTGKDARQITGSQMRITDFAMKKIRDGDTNQIELIAQAPECLLDRSTSIATSSGFIKAFTPNTNLYIEGVGFFCQQSNATLVISNEVKTTIHKSALQNRDDALVPVDSTSTNEIHITADHFLLLYESNLITYTGHVRAEDSQMELHCDVLHIFLSTNKNIDRIAAEDRVVIVNKSDNSRATGEHALYTVAPTGEILELTGNPFWTDGEREGRAVKFVFDRTNDSFRAEQNAVFKMPREKIGQFGLFAANPTSTTNAPSDKKVVITSDLTILKMPPTNGPMQEMIAEKNVVITSESDDSRATGERAVYNQTTGLLTLTGHPEWKIKDTEITGEILSAGGTNQFFAARTNVHLKLPAALFGKFFPANVGTNTVAATNQVVEFFADDFRYETNRATFRQNVRGKTVDANLTRTALLCDFLQLDFGASNQVRFVVAHQKVFLQQVPGALAQSKVLEKSIAADLMALERSPETGSLQSIHAENKVVGEQTEQTPQGKVTKRISGELMDVKFSPTTNQVTSVTAEQNVVAKKIENIGGVEKTAQASGQRANYQAVTDTVEMTGHPSAKSDTMLLEDATVLRWNLQSGKISSTGRNKMTPLSTKNSLRELKLR